MKTGMIVDTMYARWIDHRLWLHWSWMALELGLAVALLWPRTRRAGLWASVLVLSFLTGLLVMELQRSVPQPCGCGGVAAVTRLADICHGLQWALARNAGFETLVVCILFLLPAQKSFMEEAKTEQV